MLNNFARGSVYFYNFGNEPIGHLEFKTRPCVIVSNNDNNINSNTVLVAPITTRSKENCKHWQVYFKNKNRDQVILCEQIRVVCSDQLKSYMGQLDELIMREVDKALAIMFNLNVCENELNANDFLYRLDLSLDRIIGSKFKHDNVTFNNVVKFIKSSQISQEQLIKDFINKLSSNDYNKILMLLNNLIEVQNKNKISLDKIINSLIDLYSSLKMETAATFKSENNSTINIKSINKESNVTQFKADVDKIFDNNINNINKVNKRNNYSKLNVETALKFVNDWNNNSIDDLIKIYKMDRKQICNKKYYICKFLTNHGINFSCENKRIGRRAQSKNE